ncbi:MAG TPA: GapA-binding peptide SR1P [Bacillota bacterium]|nr:GapA-binding peptide SR1P [Bacillota bacterium]
MGTIVCQGCQKIIEHFKHEKVSTLYGKCKKCLKKTKN